MKKLIKGHYCFRQNERILFENDNIITLLGESFFLNRMINNQFEPIQYIMLGTASVRPKKSDIALGNMTIKKRVSTSADIVNKKIILKAKFEAKDIINTSEIGVSNGEILISHDVYDKISEDFLSGSIGAVDVEYTFSLTSAASRKDFTKSDNFNNVYWIAEPTYIVGVTETNTQSGYKNVLSVEDVEETPGSYFYSTNTNNLYVHTTKNSDPNLEDVIIETR